MKTLIIGNRERWTYDFVRKKLLELGVKKTDLIISGGAIGVDQYAQDFAKEIGAQIRIIYPDPDLASPQKYFDRNEKMAELCDKVIAFNHHEDSGTQNTINHATKFGKEIIVIKNGN